MMPTRSLSEAPGDGGRHDNGGMNSCRAAAAAATASEHCKLWGKVGEKRREREGSYFFTNHLLRIFLGRPLTMSRIFCAEFYFLGKKRKMTKCRYGFRVKICHCSEMPSVCFYACRSSSSSSSSPTRRRVSTLAALHR